MESHRLALPVGSQIEHLRIEAVLGKGGFGITYLAVDARLGKRVAIKELLPDTIATRVEHNTVVPHSSGMQQDWEWARERFLEEARALAAFSHPAIVGIHRLIEANGTVYMVMDYVEGESYEARLQRIGTEPDEASLMAVIGPILSGLEEVHVHGLLHRDIKPENILIDKRGQPILIDFGSARESVGKTMTMTSIVTHGYSPIEQYQTKGRMGPWTDIYATAALMCRAITGQKPPVASDRVLDDDFEGLSRLQRGGYTYKFLQSVDWGLQVRPNERPQTVRDFIRRLASEEPAQTSLPVEPASVKEERSGGATEQIPDETASTIPARQQAAVASDSEQNRSGKKAGRTSALVGIVSFVAIIFIVPALYLRLQASRQNFAPQSSAALVGETKVALLDPDQTDYQTLKTTIPGTYDNLESLVRGLLTNADKAANPKAYHFFTEPVSQAGSGAENLKPLADYFLGARLVDNNKVAVLSFSKAALQYLDQPTTGLVFSAQAPLAETILLHYPEIEEIQYEFDGRIWAEDDWNY
jgi:serine/threonine protein kinase